MKLIQIFTLVVFSFSQIAFASENISINKMLDENDFPDQVSRELMGVANGEVLLFSSTPSETLTLDCKSGSGQLAHAIYSQGSGSVKSDYKFDSIDKCEGFAQMLRDGKERIGSDLIIKIELDQNEQKIKSIHFSEGL